MRVCRRLRQRPAHRIAAAHGAVQAAGHQSQQLVADGGAKRVGDAAEAVAVDKQHREFAVRVGTGLVQRLGDVFDDDGAVRQRRQCVGARQVAPLRRHALLFLQHGLRHIADAGHERLILQFQQADRQRLRRRAARSGGPQRDAQRLADHAAGRAVGGRLRPQLRRRGGEHVEQVGEVAVGNQRHQQLRRHRVDHGDLAVRCRLEQADRRLVQKLHQGLVGGRRIGLHKLTAVQAA